MQKRLLLWVLLVLMVALLAAPGCTDDGSGNSSDADSDGDTDSDADTDADTDTDTETNFPESITMVSLTGGTFTMGGTSVAGDAPQVSVTLSPFEIAATEITNEQYVAFLNHAYADGWIVVEDTNFHDPCGLVNEKGIVGAGEAPYAGQFYLQLGETGGCTSDGEEEHIDNKSWIEFNAGTFELIDDTKAGWPVNWVRWYGANAFASYYGVQLPTEAQWEYAARGGLQYEYPTDDGILTEDQANYNGATPGVYDPDGHSVAVGSYPPNPFGLYDMGGNVWEWCQDFYAADFYTDGTTDPLNTVEGTESRRVRRGGSWNYHSTTLRTFERASDIPDRGNNHFGFRVVNNN